LLRNLESSLGIAVYETTVADEAAVAILMKEIKLDFDDCLQYFAAKRLGAEAIVSYDKHYDGLDVTRVEPKDVLEKLRL